MKVTRKDFLRIAAGSVVAAGTGTLVHALSGSAPATAATVGESKQRWGMVIDLRQCRQQGECDQCIRACHQTHNVPEVPNPAHEVKWIWNEPFAKVFPFQQSEYTRQADGGTLPVLCNHCASPSCVRVCPTKATWKRGDGIVMMDYHRCIGCRYCMAACPYGSRSFNYVDPRPHLRQVNPEVPTRSAGVVEKCDFCTARLAKGELPACVEACPQGAMVFGDLNDESSPVRQLLAERYSVQRQPHLGCGPSIFYLV
ncbi:MAG: 4Fe-4S dicluster domain-containing protein [Desulfuromonadales bacterium]|nr:4Fe-4S dicluster domain-containing protein [Desulfuromonadales bacterium]